MGLGKHGTPLTTFDPRPTDREVWSVRREQKLEAGIMVEHQIPWDQAKALGMLTRLHHKGKPKVIRLSREVSDFIEREQRPGEESLAPAIERLIKAATIPRNFYTPQCQRKAKAAGDMWAADAINSMQDVAKRDAAIKQAQDLARRYRR